MKKLLLCLTLCACGRDITAPVVATMPPPATINGPCQKFVVRVDTVYQNGHHYEIRDSVTAYYSHCPTP